MASYSISNLQTNGLTERFNQTLSRYLAKLCNHEHTDWDDKIDTILMGYRASFQSSTKHSPYFMLFQQVMRLPIDVEMMPDNQTNEASEDCALESIIHAISLKREKIFKSAKENILEAQERNKKKPIIGSIYLKCFQWDQK